MPAVLWYVIVSALGWVAFPLAYRLLPALADRGYAFSRPLGLLVWGYSYWLLGSLGVIRNDPGGLVFASLLLLGLGSWAVREIGWSELRAWMRTNRTTILVVEGVFLAAFALWVVVRAANPGIFGTEKPMEMAFMNAILTSPRFPPADPWLSGYAISYYYFGYVLAAMLARMTGLTAGVAFNLSVSLVFALSAAGAYGIVHNLLARLPSKKDDQALEEAGSASLHLRALLGPIVTILIGNLVGLLEVLHHRGIFWRTGAGGERVSAFWTWLDLRELSQPPLEPLTWLPRRFGTGEWWWWRASRVVQDYDLMGGWREIIDEFPMFSFILADLHPHVLAIPFAFLAMALALNIYLDGAQGRLDLPWRRLRRAPQVGGGVENGGTIRPAQDRARLPFGAESLLLIALVLGGLAFLNTWDFPIYLALVAGAFVLQRARLHGWGWDRAWDFLTLAVVVGGAGVLLYLPFYIGFASQAGGIIPNLVYVTRGAHLWVMFGLLFLLLFPYLLSLWRSGPIRPAARIAVLVSIGLVLGLWLLSLLMGWVAISLPVVGDLYLGTLGAEGTVGSIFQQALLRRITSPGGWLTLVILLTLVLGLLWPRPQEGVEQGPQDRESRPHRFVLLLILLGALLVLGPEFLYLRDQFGWRINTIFKFYYQAWLLWGIASAYGAGYLLARRSGRGQVGFQMVLVGVLLAGLVYPVLGVLDRTEGFRPSQGWNLDGTVGTSYLAVEDTSAIQWLRSAPYGVVAEAVGGSYTQYGRVSATSGYPSVLGWPGHESQWRGGYAEMGSRQEDIERLYTTRFWEEAEEVLRAYGIRYVYVGELERSTYRVYEPKFRRFLAPVYENGEVVIYEVPAEF